MDRTKRRNLVRAGWRVGSTREFLELSPEETAFVEVKLALSESLRSRRLAQGLSQMQVARRMGSSQSRVAKMEAGDPEVSVDLLVHALLALGATPRDLASAIGGGDLAAAG